MDEAIGGVEVRSLNFRCESCKSDIPLWVHNSPVDELADSKFPVQCPKCGWARSKYGREAVAISEPHVIRTDSKICARLD
jgi:Zn finger protein HypA/HybF involved in hydrogenase expression